MNIDLLIKILEVILLGLAGAVLIEVFSILFRIYRKLNLIFDLFRVVVDLGEVTTTIKKKIKEPTGRLILNVIALVLKIIKGEN